MPLNHWNDGNHTWHIELITLSSSSVHHLQEGISKTYDTAAAANSCHLVVLHYEAARGCDVYFNIKRDSCCSNMR